MAWYGWLIIGLLIATTIALAIVVIVFYYRLRKSNVGLSTDEQIKLLSLAREGDQKAIKIEQEKRASLQQIAVKLQSTLEQLQLEHDKSITEIDDASKKEFDRLRTNTSDLNRELDIALGIKRPDDTSRS